MLKSVMLVILFLGAGFSQTCFASISLSVNPVDGSSSLRFEKFSLGGMENKKEIHIRVNSINGGRYQIFQRILEPIMNEKGDALNLQAIQTQTLPNSNSSGTLYLQNSGQLSMGDQLLYSSSQSGESDSFIAGYSLNQSLINAGGSFRGRLIFTVRGMTDGSTDQVTVDVLLDASSNLKISVKGAHDPARIHIKDSDLDEKSADFVNISFSGNSGQEIRIYQETDTFPQNDVDQQLGSDVLQLDTQGQTEGLRVPGLSPLGNSRTLIYSGNKEEDSFIIYYLVNANQVQEQDAGSYVGKIKYIVESSQGNQEFPINVQCDISPVFSMNITTPPGGVAFSHVLANTLPQEEEVMVAVFTNLHKPYQVLQDIQTNMVNQQGKEFNNKYFNIQVEIPPGQRGQTDFTEFSPVQVGEYPVFSSDNRGSSATFKVVYRLQGYNQMSPGDFSTPIKFSLNQK